MTTPKQSAQAPAARCPICGKPADADYRPFCSKRCADVDLQRWLSGAYVIPGELDGDGEVGESIVDDEG